MTSDGKKNGEAEKTGEDGSTRKVEIDDDIIDPEDIEILQEDIDSQEAQGHTADTPEVLSDAPEWLQKIDDGQEQGHDGKTSGRKKQKKTSKADMAEHLARKNEMLQKLRERLVEIEKIVEIKEDRLMRLAAEFENYKKRTSREWDLLKNQANAGLILEMLGVLDDLDRAFEHSGDSIEHFREGIALIHSSLVELFRRNGLREIEAAGKPFDPQFHEAIAEMTSEDIEPGSVAEVVRKGYMLNDQVIRPARVVVSKDSG